LRRFSFDTQAQSSLYLPHQKASSYPFAASEASGLKSNFGKMVKPFHAGKAAGKGLTAALLAKSGFVANKEVFKSQFGFLSLYGGKQKLYFTGVTENLGQSFEIVFPNVNIKKYPCCYHTHSVMDTLVSVAKKHNLLPQDIKSIHCGIHEIANKTLIHRILASGLEGNSTYPTVSPWLY
jgi:2-methylcitrate dehydratase PrpD